MSNPLPFRQVHLDFHTSELIPHVGRDFDKKQFQKALKLGNVNSITLFAKCHHGWSYYPTKVGAPHPQLERPDLLGDQIAACREIGVATPVYITVQWDERTAREHPEWRVMKADGGPGQEQLSAMWHPLCLSNKGVVDQIVGHAEEVIDTYHPEGFFFDIVLAWECVCPNCVARMKKTGRNPGLKADRLANHRDLILEYYRRVSSAVRAKDPQCRIYHNSHVAKGERERWQWFSHLELESLPTGGWGWDHFPLGARYAATLGMDYLGMSGKFHTTWGEFGGYKTEACLEYECAAMVAQGARCSIGDQLHPLGKMDEPTYQRLGKAYRRVEALEPYSLGATNVSDLAILAVESVLHRSSDGDAGAARVLLEAHQMFDIVDAEASFEKYKLLILPDEIVLEPKLAAKINAYVAAGGSLILSGTSGMNPAADSFVVDVGAKTTGQESPWNPDYIAALPALKATAPGARLVDSPFVVYERARMVKAAGGEVLAAVHEPYFNRTWDAFCSHQHAPAREERSTAYDAIVRKGRVIYFSHPIFTAYKKIGQPLLRDLVLAALELLLPQTRLTVTMPTSGRVTLQRQAAQKRTLVHLAYAQPALRGGGVAFTGGTPLPLEIVEDTVPLFDVACSLQMPTQPKGVRLALAGTKLPFTWDGSRAVFTVPRIDISETVVIEE